MVVIEGVHEWHHHPQLHEHARFISSSGDELYQL
jgi:hypothetical protein